MITQGARARAAGAAKPVRSRLGTALWLLATILLAGWDSAGACEARPEALGVSKGAAHLTPQAGAKEPSVLPRGLPRVVASETDRQKLIPGHDGKSFGLIPKEPLLLVAAPQGTAPIPHSVLCSVRVRNFEPRGPPSRIA